MAVSGAGDNEDGGMNVAAAEKRLKDHGACFDDGAESFLSQAEAHMAPLDKNKWGQAAEDVNKAAISAAIVGAVLTPFAAPAGAVIEACAGVAALGAELMSIFDNDADVKHSETIEQIKAMGVANSVTT